MNYGTRGFIMVIMRGGGLWYKMARQYRQGVVTGCSSTAVDVPSVCRYRLQQYCRKRAGHMVLRVLYFCQQCL